MRLLFVEDDPTFIEGLVPRLQKIGTATEVVVAKSRDSAVQELQHAFFDTVILDLKIPSKDGAADAVVDYGYRVFVQALETAPGTPVYILTGSSAEPLIPDLLQHTRQDDFWGERKDFASVSLLPKSRLPEFLGAVASINVQVEALRQIEIAYSGKPIDLTPEERRVLRIFARRRGGVQCAVSPLSGGLSGSRILRIKVHNSDGALQIDAAGKISALTDVEDESTRYEQVVRLAPGSYPTRVETVKSGAKNTAGVFYSLLRGYEESVFDRIIKGMPDIGSLVTRTASLFAAWREGVPAKQGRVREIRRRLLNDETTSQLVQLYDLDEISDFENRELLVRWCCVHGDLHGANVLVNAPNDPMVIDFGDVGPGAAALDAITLELSIFFHPNIAPAVLEPKTKDIIKGWANLDTYSSQFPFAEFIRACRAWAHEVAAGDRCVYACAYAYALRQLKYPETDKDVALALLRAVMDALNATY